jgi:hypothetical protein
MYFLFFLHSDFPEAFKDLLMNNDTRL